MSLTVTNLKITTHGRALTHGTDLHIEPGEWSALIGESGSGKSITAHAIADLLPAGLRRSADELSFAGCDLLRAKPHELRQLRGTQICYVFQNYAGAFSPYHRIRAHLVEALRAHCKLDRGQEQAIIGAALEEVGLDPEVTMSRYPFQLSGGQLQRVALATAIMFRPRLLIVDEPTTALDAVTQAEILASIDKLRHDTGCSVLFITHDLRCVAGRADTITVMRDGDVLERGMADQLINAPTHQYTRSLFAAIPPIDQDIHRLPLHINEEQT